MSEGRMEMKKNGFDEGYMNLYAAIYKQAVADDCREVRKKVKDILTLKGADSRRIRSHLEEMEPEIKDLVCEAVYKEAQEYGGKTRKMQREAIVGIVNLAVDAFKG